jgi:hypothetical protein
MIHALDHLVILTDDLTETVAAYEQVGFRVAPGGRHADGATENRLVAFADGTYLELLAFLRDAPQHRWSRHRDGGPGLIDFALLPQATAAAVADAADRGLRLDGPHAGGRLRPDGIELRWQTATAASSDLPFLCGDETPRELRVPAGAWTAHANGVAGIAELVIAVNQLPQSVGRYSALLGSQPQLNPGEARFTLGTATLVLRSALSGDERVTDRLARRGEGPLAIGLRVSGAVPQLPDVLTYRVAP